MSYPFPRATVSRSQTIEAWTGIEGTHIGQSDTNILETTRHHELYKRDLIQIAIADGIKKVRIVIPWPKIEKKRNKYDWTWCDLYLAFIRRLGLTPVVDLIHHTSTPKYLKGGFLDPDFPERARLFHEVFARRYPWIKHYTPVNEPFSTAWHAGHEGVWFPNLRGHEGYVPIALNMARAICLITETLRKEVPGVQIIHVDSCEYHQALDKESEYHAEKSNEIRFSILDLVLGRDLDEHKHVGPIFREHGMTEYDVEWFKEHAATIDVLGLDYYAIHEAGWTVEGRSEDIRPLGLRRVALQYARRYQVPIMLGETNMRGYIEDRISWFKYTLGECELLEAELARMGLSFKGYCWYPYFDSTDWCSMVCEPNGNIDPQGIYWLSKDTLERNPSEFTDLYARFANGKLRAADIPAYHFGTHVLDLCSVRKFLPLMRGWDWKEPAHTQYEMKCAA